MEAKVYLARKRAAIEKEYGNRWGEIYSHYPELTFIDPNDEKAVRENWNDHIDLPRNVQMTLIITNAKETVVGFDVPSALDLWSDYMVAIDELLYHGGVKRMYGIDPIQLEMQLLDEGLIRFTVRSEWKKDHLYASALVPAVPFLLAVLNAIRFFWSRMREYTDTTPIVNKIDKILEEVDSVTVRVKALKMEATS